MMHSSLVVPLCFRTIVFAMFYIMFWMFDGIANWNSSLLMLFLALVIPLPTFKPVTIACEKTFYYTVMVFRFIYRVLLYLHNAVLIPTEQFIRKYVLVWIVRIIIVFIMVNGFSLKLLVSVVMYLVPQFLKTYLLNIIKTLAVFPATLARYSGSVISYVLPRLKSGNSRISEAYSLALEDPVSFIRLVGSGLMHISGLIIAIPGPVSAFNYAVTSYAYPGSLIRFQHCDKFKYEHKPFQHYFLQFSYCIWNTVRSYLFYKFSNNTDHWSMDIDLTKLFHAAVNGWLATHLRLLAIGAFVPLYVDFQCSSQAVHNIICTFSNLIFLILLNGHRKLNMLMVYFTCSIVLLHAQSLVVSVSAALHSLQCSMNSFVITLLCMLELYFMFYVTVDTCKKAIQKIRNAGDDVLGIWPSTETVSSDGQETTNNQNINENVLPSGLETHL